MILRQYTMLKAATYIHSSPLPTRLLLLLLLLLASSPSAGHRRVLAAAPAAGAGGGPSTIPSEVGVILDLSTWMGNISWSLMSMAVDDFYAANPKYTTRLSLHLRDTKRSDTVASAAAALDLIENVKVEAIVGPQTSMQAKFIIGLGNRTEVPILSFSAMSLLLPSSRSPYFIRTAWNDSSQATVIASLVEAFSWMEVVPVVEDSDYGNAIIPYLVDAFEAISVNVPYRSLIPISATKDQIVAELKKMNSSRTRVFVVHMSSSLGLTFFSVAKEVGMMQDGYVWIIPYGLTEAVTAMGSSAIDVMQGVLGVKPYDKESERLRNLKVRWRKQYQRSDPNANVTEPTMFGLWAYDTVWLLAMAAESLETAFPLVEIDANSSSSSARQDSNASSDLARLGSSPRGSRLLNLLLMTQFNGVSGEFHLIDGQLQSTIFEIINVVKEGTRTVGFWTPTFGISRHMNTKFDLKPIMWPGGRKIRPKGWEWPTNGKKLKIGIPVEPGFSQFVNTTIDPVTRKQNYTGYCIEVFNAVMKLLPYDVPYEYHPFVDRNGQMNGTYDDLVYQVYLQNYDAVVGDVTILANRSLYVDFTLPYTESGVSLVVPIKDKSNKNAWTFLEPLTANLWLVSGAFFVFTGLVVWVLEHRINKEFQGQPLDQVGTVFYFSFSTLVFAHREQILSNLARIVLIIWVFVVLILQQSYTASLTALLTVGQLQPTVTDLNELVKNENFVGYLNGSFMPGLLKQLNFNESKLIAYNTPEEYNEALANGSVAAVVDEIPYLRVFLSKYCKKYTMIGPTYKTGGFGFVFAKGSPLVRDISKVILNVTESDIMVKLENELYGNSTCPDDGVSQTTSSSLTLSSFWGLFLISGATTLAALLAHLLVFIYAHWHLSKVSSDGSLRQRFSMLVKLYYQTDGSSDASKKAEARDGPEVAEISTFPFTPRTPSISNYTHGNATPDHDDNDGDNDYNHDGAAEIMPEDEGTPGREIANQDPGCLSFAEMLNERQ